MVAFLHSKYFLVCVIFYFLLVRFLFLAQCFSADSAARPQPKPESISACLVVCMLGTDMYEISCHADFPLIGVFIVILRQKSDLFLFVHLNT